MQIAQLKQQMLRIAVAALLCCLLLLQLAVATPPSSPSAAAAAAHSAPADGAFHPSAEGDAETAPAEAEAPRDPDAGEVVTIDEANFLSEIGASKQPWLLLFCSGQEEEECERVVPAFAAAARNLRNHVRFGLVEGESKNESGASSVGAPSLLHSKFAGQFGVRELPAVRFWDQHAASKSPQSARSYEGSLTLAAMQQFARGMVDASRVGIVRERNFAQWLAQAPEQSPTSDAVSMLRVLLFNFSPEIPAYLQALSIRYAGQAQFGVTQHTDRALVLQFGVTQVPSLFLFSAPRRISEAQLGNAALIPLDIDGVAGRYAGLLTFNQISAYVDEVLRRMEAAKLEATHEQEEEKKKELLAEEKEEKEEEDEDEEEDDEEPAMATASAKRHDRRDEL